MNTAQPAISGGWHAGAAHSDPVTTVSRDHQFVVRLTYGRGWEAWESDRLRPAEWLAYAVDYAPPGSVRRHATDLAADWVYVCLPQMEFEEVADLTGFRSISPAGQSGGPACPVADDIRRAVLSGRSGERLHMEPLFYALAAQIAARLGARRTTERVALPPRALRRVLDYVDASLGNPIGLDDMASVANLSRFHFAKAFKQATGHAPYNYVLTRRLIHARDLLTRSGRPLAEISHATGFASQPHFTDAFKRAFGIAPGRFRTKSL